MIPAHSRCSLNLRWNKPPQDAEASLRQELLHFGLKLTERTATWMEITTRSQGAEVWYAVSSSTGKTWEINTGPSAVYELTELALAVALLSAAPPGDAPNVEIGLHCGQYDWNRGEVDLLLTAREADPTEVRERFCDDLERLYRALGRIRPKRVLLKAAVTPGIAMQIGWVFREITGMPVVFDGGPKGPPDPFEHASADGDASGLWLRTPEGDPSSEVADAINIVVLPNPQAQFDVFEHWRRQWRVENPGVKDSTLMHMDRLDIPTGSILAWAKAISQQIQQKRMRDGQIRVVRLFFGGPIALTYAIGRVLNAVDQLEIFDRAPTGETYVKRFTLRR